MPAILLALALAPAAAREPEVAAARPRCEAAAAGAVVLAEAERADCRALWLADVERARARQREWREEQARAFARRRAGVREARPATLRTFIDEGGLGHGDIVVTDQGPRVFIGDPSRPATTADFVALDSPRSPHRGRAGELRRAARPR